MPAVLLATLDTKGTEAAFLRDRLVACGVPCLLVDTGCLGSPTVVPDVTRDEFYSYGPKTLSDLQRAGVRGEAISAAEIAAQRFIETYLANGELLAVAGLGGSAGTTIASAALRALPLGLPKLLVSTLASGQTRPFIRDKDIVLFNPVVDIAGLNRISREVLSSAAEALAGMVRFRRELPRPAPPAERPLLGATMFGVTTPCVQVAREALEQAGFEVLVFHATGAGGQALESLVRDGQLAGVLDLTTTELADELVGGVLSAGPDRLTAAGAAGIPQVISVGALDMVNFGPFETVPPRFAGRLFHRHNANVTLMRTTPAECRALGEEIGRKAAAARGPVHILFPARGISALDAPGQPFDSPEARIALREGLQATAGKVPVELLDLHINDREFAQAAARILESWLGR
jgi:uncharacterized protein (UPF0261 family)